MTEAIEEATGRRINGAADALLAPGAALVRSGLEDTMIDTFAHLVEVRDRLGQVADLRTAAFVVAIDKIAACYSTMGIFP